jgi:hypothetical protein
MESGLDKASQTTSEACLVIEEEEAREGWRLSERILDSGIFSGLIPTSVQL